MNNVKFAKFREHILIKSVFAWKKMILLHFHLIIQVILVECSLLTCKPSYLKQDGRWGERKAFFGKKTAALRLLMHLNPEQKMKSLWAGAKQYNDFPLILESSWTACPAWSKSHMLHFALTLHTFYTPTNAVSHQSFPRLTKEKPPSLLLLFITFIMAQGLCCCCWHWTSFLQSQWAHFFFWLCFWA